MDNSGAKKGKKLTPNTIEVKTEVREDAPPKRPRAPKAPRVRKEVVGPPESIEDIPQFVCVLCSKTFSIAGLRDLDKHIMEAHSTDLFCVKCKDTFDTKSEVSEHQEKCDNEQLFYKKIEFIECVFCRHLYRRDKLKKHISLEHSDDKPSKPRRKKGKPGTSSAVLETITNGNTINLSHVSNIIKEKLLGFSSKLNSALISEDDIKTEKIEEDADEVQPPAHKPNINITSLKRKLQISLSSDDV